MKSKEQIWSTLLVSIIFIVMGATPGQAAIPDSERLALVYLHYSTGGADWSHNTGWLGPIGTECDWYGVTCDAGSSSVIAIDLYSNNLVGALPYSLGGLPGLLFLDLSANHLSGPIPSELGGLSELQELYLFTNQLDGSIPPELGDLSNLLELQLASNSLSGPIPPELGGLSSLYNLNLERNELTGVIPPELGSLSNLNRLLLRKNQLEGTIPPVLGSLSALVGLYLEQNQLTGSIPPELLSLSNLKYLHLEFNQLSGSIPPELGGLSQLRTLHLEDNQLSGSIPPELGDLSNLLELQLTNNSLSGPIPPELGGLFELLELRLSSNQLSGSIPPELGGLSSLWRLYLYSNYLSGPIPSELSGLFELLELRLSSNQLVGDIPVSLISLTNLGNSGNDLDYNGLFSEDPAVRAFLAQKFGPNWADTQTVAPDNFSVVSVMDHAVWLEWDPVTYIDPGGYEVFVAPTGTGFWASAGWTGDKSTTEFPVTGLDDGTSYDVAVASFTEPHAQNDNFILSSSSAPIMATTANTGCSELVILINWGGEITLSVDDTYETFLWSTGETTPSIVVAPALPQWYWVTVSFVGPCEESNSVLVDPATVFADGFDLGDTSAWSQVLP